VGKDWEEEETVLVAGLVEAGGRENMAPLVRSSIALISSSKLGSGGSWNEGSWTRCGMRTFQLCALVGGGTASGRGLWTGVVPGSGEVGVSLGVSADFADLDGRGGAGFTVC
jgi:hypothetical protein